MSEQLVVGLFQSSGIALDALHRLHTEGVPASRLAHRVLRETAPPPPTVQAELAALQVDPMVLGDVQNNFVKFIHNGETAVFVSVADADEAKFAGDILKLYGPVAIAIVPSSGRPVPGVEIRSPPA